MKNVPTPAPNGSGPNPEKPAAANDAVRAAARIIRRFRSQILRYLFWGILTGAVIACLPPVLSCRWEAAATVALWTLACLVCGMLGGFLFAIPKVFQGSRPEGEGAPPTGTKPGTRVAAGTVQADSPYALQINTNLEQISDWLCKIIVGLGLIELRTIPGRVGELASGLSADLGAGLTLSFAAGVIVYFLVAGFLSGYLFTRLFLAGEFGRADRDAIIGEAREEAERVLDARLANQIEEMDVRIAVVTGKLAYQGDVNPPFLDNAITELEKAHQLRPAHRRVAMVLSSLYGKKGMPEKALEMLERTLQAKTAEGTDADSDAADLHFNRAGFLLRIGERVGVTAEQKAKMWEKMYSALERAITLKPKNAEEAWNDEDLQKLRGEEKFLKLVGR